MRSARRSSESGEKDEGHAECVDLCVYMYIQRGGKQKRLKEEGRVVVVGGGCPRFYGHRVFVDRSCFCCV